MLCVFRLVQEALQNAIKHSRSSEVSVSLMAGSDELGVRVVDNGVGFDVNGAWRNGLGLISMLERVEAIGGSLQIRSTPGGGTSVVATMPLAVAPPVTEQIVASGAVATRDAN